MPNKMHKEVLTDKQVALFPLVKIFMKDFGLVGGTAAALQIGHRRSIDFDLFSLKEFGNLKIKNFIIRQGWKIEKTFRDELGQLTIVVDDVLMTFFHYPFEIKFTERFEDIKIPDLAVLAAMKAYALGRRAKWKDYVDLFFIFKKYGSIKDIMNKGKEIFGNEFNERLFREQLSYFDDIDHSETVDFLPGFETSEEEIKKELIEFSLEL
jgi:hypothetical protein